MSTNGNMDPGEVDTRRQALADQVALNEAGTSLTGPARTDGLRAIAVLTRELVSALEKRGHAEDLTSAEKMLEVLIVDLRRECGRSDAATIDTVICIRDLLNKQSRFRDTKPHALEAYKASLEAFGADHSSTLLAQSAHGMNLLSLKMFPQAEAVLVEVLERQEALLGMEAPRTLTDLNNLSAVYRATEE
jgi:hypothetical protein